MKFYADLHVHSHYARGTSKNLTLENLALWARKKGISVVATGDFTHPAWLAELKEKLVPAEPGLFRLRPDIERAVQQKLPLACQGDVRFLLEVEISTIYKKGEKTRKVHHLVYAPDFAQVDAMVERLAKIGNLASDGRPILGLDSRDLLEIVLESGPDTYLVPAHIWTPWFAALGSKSGFDSIGDCYGDLAEHIFAVETGLSSDPPMNWRISDLDRFRLVSNSDAHSPSKLGREATVFHTSMDYFSIRNSLETGDGFGGTVEFFPEEGKYHMDGHRACKVRLSPAETREAGGRCPSCGRLITIGVMHRIEALADRPEGWTPEDPEPFRSFVPLPEVLGELEDKGPKTKRVQGLYERLLSNVGPELQLLEDQPLETLRRTGPARFAEAIERMRSGDVVRNPGYDGEYGTIRCFAPGELNTAGTLFAMQAPRAKPTKPAKAPAAAPTETPLLSALQSAAKSAKKQAPNALSLASDSPAPFLGSDKPVSTPSPTQKQDPEETLVEGLDPEQGRAAVVTEGPLLVIAGPGTGKTRTLTYRLARMVNSCEIPAKNCLAITFTRRAAAEMRERLKELLPDAAESMTISTFHGLALDILREDGQLVGLHRGFTIATAEECSAMLQETLSVSQREADKLRSAISRAKRAGEIPADPEKLRKAQEAYTRAMELAGKIDFDDLIILSERLLRTDLERRLHYQRKFQWICIDEYQDIDAQQYGLIRALVPEGGNLCAIGDPDQAIYGFRGAEVGFFLRFKEDFPGAKVVRLARNYRSTTTIVDAAQALMEKQPLPGGRELRSVGTAGVPISVHTTKTERSEAEYVVKTLEKLLGGHTFFSIDSGRAEGTEETDYSFSDFAVLYRTESQVEALREALNRSGIPFQARAAKPLLTQDSARALVDYAEQLEGSVVERLQNAIKRPDASSNDGELLEQLRPLASAAGKDWEGFRDTLALGTDMSTWDPRAHRVSLLTLHAAKGLEFRVVFMVGCEEGVLPLRFGKETEPDPSGEERRLFYVGMTRAKDHLLLTRAKTRRWRGKIRDMDPSSFWEDIPASFWQEDRDTSKRASRKKEPSKKSQLSLW